MRILLIIPAYNEEQNIERVANAARDSGYDYIVVNDGSTDGTLALLEKNNIPHLNLRQNLGIGGAVQAGHRYAYLKGYDADIQFDGDGQHDIAFLQPLLDAVEQGADLAVGSRFLEESSGFHSTFMRRVGIRWFCFLIKCCSGRVVTDPTSGFRACGKKAIELFARDYPSDYPEPESIVNALRRGLKVREVPVQMKERQGGVSSISGLSSVYYMIKVSLAILIVSTSHKFELMKKGK